MPKTVINFGTRNHKLLDLLEISQFHYTQAKSKHKQGDILSGCISYALADVYETRYNEARS